MVSKYFWIILVIQCIPVAPRAVYNLHNSQDVLTSQPDYSSQNIPKYDEPQSSNNEQVISVRITSSVAVGRRKGIPNNKNFEQNPDHTLSESDLHTSSNEKIITIQASTNKNLEMMITETPPNLTGANIAFIKQLNAKKEQKHIISSELIHPFHPRKESYDYIDETKPILEFESKKDFNNEEDVLSQTIFGNQALLKSNNEIKNVSDPIAEPSIKSNSQIEYDTTEENTQDVPLAKSTIPAQSNTLHTILLDHVSSFPSRQGNSTDDNLAASSIKSVITVGNRNAEIVEDVPIGRSISLTPSENFFQDLSNKPVKEEEIGKRLTTVSFNVVHDKHQPSNNYKEHADIYTSKNVNEPTFYETPKIYSQPAQVYSEPAKFYSEPAKIYSEPAKIYSEPAKIYSEPAKIYSEPAKFYSPPASLHLPPEIPPNYKSWQQHSHSPTTTITSNTTPISTITSSADKTKSVPEHQPEKNYEVDEKISVLSEGRIHGVQESSTEKCKQDNCKVGYVVEGRQYKKYRVEERTADGFIVGEYGVVRNEDGALRGVRYTADSDASPRLIYDALMKFLQLK